MSGDPSGRARKCVEGKREPLLCYNHSNQPLTIALTGHDPVHLLRGEEVEGNKELAVDRGRFRYLFATKENKELFDSTPEKYEIQMDGHCAAMSDVPGNPSLFAVYDEKIYIFGSPQCREDFLAEPEAFTEG